MRTLHPVSRNVITGLVPMIPVSLILRGGIMERRQTLLPTRGREKAAAPHNER